MKRAQILAMITLTVFLGLFSALPALAGDGNGSGGGGGQQNPLTLVSSDPVDGQKDVKLPMEIKLTFNKNVVNMTVKDINQKCFTLNSSEGIVVPVEVIMADDQVDPEKNKDILLKPLQDLKLGTTYSIKIAPTLQAKNGTSLGKETLVRFTTAASSQSVNDKKVAVTSASSTTDNTNVGSAQNGDRWIKWIFGGIGVFLGLIGVKYFKRRT